MAKRILIAEDDDGSREIITIRAQNKGYEVVAVTNGFDLLAMAAKEKFDLVITDLLMPDLDGTSATEIMKLQRDKTPILALTALSPNDVLPVHATFTKIFHKPCNYNDLFEYVESLIGK
jgi:DNA-binding response OmpR family regulator